MKKTRRATEQIIRILREADTGLRTEGICRRRNISSQSFYRWKSKYGGMDLKEVQRLRDLEKENTELKKLLADQLLKTKALEIALEENLWARSAGAGLRRRSSPRCRVPGEPFAGGWGSAARRSAIARSPSPRGSACWSRRSSAFRGSIRRLATARTRSWSSASAGRRGCRCRLAALAGGGRGSARAFDLIGECARQRHCIHADRAIKASDALALLQEAIREHGAPECIRSGNGPELIAKAIQGWLGGTDTPKASTAAFARNASTARWSARSANRA